MEIKFCDAGGSEFEFRLSNKARIEIEKKDTEFLKIPEIAEVVSKMKSENEEEMREFMPALIPHLDELQNDDVFDIGYILLKNDRRYRNDMTEDKWNEIIDVTSEKYGYEETFNAMTDIVSDVFTKVARMQEYKESKVQFHTFVSTKNKEKNK